MGAEVEPEPVLPAVSLDADCAAQTAGKQHSPALYLCFSVAGSTFAVRIAAIKEFIDCGDITTVPLMPASMCGVVNLRGAALPVIDLGVLSGHAPSSTERPSCIVVVELPEDAGVPALGLVVDGVTEVLELGQQDLESVPSCGSNARSEFIEAAVRIQGRLIFVLRLGQVLSDADVSRLACLGALPSTPPTGT